MNADLKQIGPAIDKAVKAQNNNSRILNEALVRGFTLDTNKVTKSVIAEFKDFTGTTIDQFLKNEIVKNMNSSVYEAKKAKITAIGAAQTAEKLLQRVSLSIKSFYVLMTALVLELGAVIAISIALPGLWKLAGIVLTVIGSALLNWHLKDEGNEDNDEY